MVVASRNDGGGGVGGGVGGGGGGGGVGGAVANSVSATGAVRSARSRVRVVCGPAASVLQKVPCVSATPSVSGMSGTRHSTYCPLHGLYVQVQVCNTDLGLYRPLLQALT